MIPYSATMSLDGLIAGPSGDMSWLAPYLGPNPAADDLADRSARGAPLADGPWYRVTGRDRADR